MRTNEYRTAIQQLDEYKGDSLPPCWLYSILINLIGATEENRRKYGRFTCAQWVELLKG